MYDAKEKEELEDNTSITQGYCVSDRSYFGKIQNEKLTNLKSSYVPKEGLLNDFNFE
ncbi:hypothetical protein [Clostridium botulinum]|uniref:hypothetical protein n=1 Tax=Clostridium botulinum TaxID=1491 RepID=UPI0002E4FE88|nr:hypothetical protein [Clostridium botulinum]MCD3203883.1 hypothetical protein [Clostridium botulinum C/D]MCD3222390.1 hypothetical protein [Clostridium botulinum C/D]MCD3231859.1 hypothetical protein [Clostridium botulinum C/D]MCD3254597.1 hypothetical protein [Clostridium botulinum C/D]MCD3273163.1 hypothetical protein [Clostridium botulinum C/D]